jgi:hypothetical protein
MLGIRYQCIAQLWFAENSWLAGSQDWEEGQICVARNVGHLAGVAAQSQVICACCMEDVCRGHTCQRSAPWHDRPDYTAGAARDELIAGFDHGIIDCYRK